MPAVEFQSTLPVGGATLVVAPAAAEHHISIHAPRGGSDTPAGVERGGNTISIHAPRGGSDDAAKLRAELAHKISIHAPRGGSDESRLPRYQTQGHFNPRSPWGERQL